MIILVDTTGITVKRTINDADHVRIGVCTTALWINGERRAVRRNNKPHVERDIDDFGDLLQEMESLQRLSSIT